MGRRSDFPRIPKDAYATPAKAVLPLLPFLAPATRFIEPCAGDGALTRHLEEHGHVCVGAFDIEPRNPSVVRRDALTLTAGEVGTADCFITNLPWSRPLLHPLIDHLRGLLPVWTIIDANWAHTKQAAELHAVLLEHRLHWPRSLDRRYLERRQGRLLLVSLRGGGGRRRPSSGGRHERPYSAAISPAYSAAGRPAPAATNAAARRNAASRPVPERPLKEPLPVYLWQGSGIARKLKTIPPSSLGSTPAGASSSAGTASNGFCNGSPERGMDSRDGRAGATAEPGKGSCALSISWRAN